MADLLNLHLDQKILTVKRSYIVKWILYQLIDYVLIDYVAIATFLQFVTFL